MTVRLPLVKKESILKLCLRINKRSHITIREFSRLIGKVAAIEPGVEYDQLRYKPLDRIKEKHLKLLNGNFDSTMVISRSCKSHIPWWIDTLVVSFKGISHDKPSREIYIDSSKQVGVYGKTKDLRTSGHWSKEEQIDHINVLELRAIFLGLKALCDTESNTHIQLYCDNTSSCA